MTSLMTALGLGIAIVFTSVIVISWCVHIEMQEEYMRMSNKREPLEDGEEYETK